MFSDEFYTPEYAVEPLLKYLKPGRIIWCPFDTASSSYVTVLKKAKHKVIHTHINEQFVKGGKRKIGGGKDFFTTDPPKGTQFIISNPPWSLTTEVFERLFELKQSFAMLVGVNRIFDSTRRCAFFKKNIGNWEIMYLDNRVSYFKNYDRKRDTLFHQPFASAYICRGILPSPIAFESIIKVHKNKI